MTRRAGVVATLGVVGGSLAACMASPPPTPTVRLDPVQVPAPGEASLGAVAFLAGCWRGPSDGSPSVLEERWSPPEAGVMLGTSRFVREGRTVSFEFGLIEEVDDTVVYLPHPGGTASTHSFRLTRASPGEVLFEAPEHDFPKRIGYRRTPGGLEARIDGGAGDPEPRVWRLESVACH